MALLVPQLPAPQHRHEHPLDVLSFLVAQEAAGKVCALAMLTATEGGAVRAPGALMAITEDGESCGYLSGGCIDADVRLHAQSAIKAGTAKTLRYGQGSPFLDISLPCGGAIELTIFPAPDRAKTSETINALTNRSRASLTLSQSPDGFTAHYRPKLRLRIAGRSADPVALARISAAAGIDTALWSADPACLAAADEIPDLQLTQLSSPASLPETHDDEHTAFVLMMHDQDWEPVLLTQALNGSAFYIGAVGSPHTHIKRSQSLQAHGVSAASIARIHAPIGLVPSLRDASMLAISTLAEIIKTFHSLPAAQPIDKRTFANV